VSFEDGANGEKASGVDYKPIADALRVRCQALVAKGKAARTRISMLENELAIAINDKEAMDQWARVCQRRATGAEEARIGTMEELRDVKFRTRAIRLGQNTTFESQNVELVTAAVRIEELSDQVVEVTEYYQMNKLKLEDVTRERDELLAEKENAAKRQEAQAKWNALLSPKGVLERAGLTSVADVVDLQTPATETVERVERVATEAVDKLDVSGSEAAAAIEAAAGDAEMAVAAAAATATKTLAETAEETDSAKKERRKKRQADFSILEFLGLVTPEPITPDVSMEMASAEQTTTEERSETTTAVESSEQRSETTIAVESSERRTETMTVVESSERRTETMTVESTMTETAETKMATESSSAAASSSSEKVQGTGTPDEIAEAPKKKGFASLGSAIDKHDGDSDDDESEEEEEATTTTTTRASAFRSETTLASSSVETEEREETEIITTTTTRTITTTTIINSDGEEEEIVEELIVETDADGNVLSETTVNIAADADADADATADDGDETTGGPSFWSRMNANAQDVHPDSDSE
jgi:hypothetical protein